MQWPEIGLSVEKKEFEEPRAEKCENPDIYDIQIYMTDINPDIYDLV